MEIKKLVFEKKEIEVKETYIDEEGKTRERVKKVLIPTGKCLGETDKNEQQVVPSNEKG